MILEEKKRLADSLLWKLQTTAYEQFGLKAWSQKGVPFYLTSNPLIAKYYAQIAWNYLQDCVENEKADLNKPFYCFDLGAGTGKLAYLFLKEFIPLLQTKAWGKKIDFCYVLTDIVEENRLFWQSHSLLKPFFSEGLLESAYFHHLDSKDFFYLEYSKKEVPTANVNPFILIANYFFDTIPQDLFRMQKGALLEGRVSLTTGKSGNGVDPEMISSLKLSWDYFPLNEETASRYYSDCGGAQAILDYYRSNYHDLTFMLPYGACQTLDFFKRQQQNGFLLLASDQGLVTQNQVESLIVPQISLHGSFSLPVNYHALANYFHQYDGQAFCSDFPDPLFVTMAAVIGSHCSFAQTKSAFDAFLNAFEPKDYWKLVEEGLKRGAPSLDEMILWIKLGNWDPVNFNAFFTALREAFPQATETQRIDLLKVIENVYKNFFYVEKSDGAFVANLGVLCFDLHQYEAALFYFERAAELNGQTSSFLQKNISLCLRLLPGLYRHHS